MKSSCAPRIITLCPQCAAEVDGQPQARSALRDSTDHHPGTLFHLLAQIRWRDPDEGRPHRRPPSVTSWQMRERRRKRRWKGGCQFALLTISNR